MENNIEETIEDKAVNYTIKLGKWGEYLLLIALAALVMFGIVRWAGKDVDMSPIKDANKRSGEIQTEIDSLKLNQKFLMERSFILESNQAQLQSTVDNFGRKIDIANARLLNIQKIYNGKISSIDKYTRTQLDSAIADYYRKHRDE